MAVDTNRLLHDRVLAGRARDGDGAAFDELFRRHGGTAWRLALAVTPETDLAAGAVIGAFATTLAGPAAPSLAVGARVRLLTAARHGALDAAARNPRPGGAPADDPALRALHDLPELWRSALWLVDVESLPVADAEAVLGLGRGVGGPLAERARGALRQRVVAATRDEPRTRDCRRTVGHLARYASGALTSRDEARVRAHLDGCAACRDRLAALDDVAVRLRAALPALPPALAGTAHRRWSASLVREPGPLHLVLPGGRPLPAWFERTVAGAAAAAIAVGITAAVLAGGKGRARDDDPARQAVTDQPVGGDGEVALGGGDGLPPIVLDGEPAPAVPPVEPLRPLRTAATPPEPPPLPRLAPPAPPTGDGGGAPLPDGGTGSDAPATPPPAGPQDPPPAPSGSEPLHVEVPGVLGVTLGEGCLGLELLGTPLGGCQDTTANETTDGSLPGLGGLLGGLGG